jgi:DNA-binding response OmpR family regulator
MSALRTGFQGYIEKPINPEAFVAEVNGFLERKGGTCEDPQH